LFSLLSNQSAKLDEASADDLNQLFALFDAVNIGRWCFLSAGIALVVASVIMFAVYFPVNIKILYFILLENKISKTFLFLL